MSPALICLLALAITAIAIPLLTPVARRLGLIARTGGHRLHHGDVPLVGGIAMFIAFFVALVLGEWQLKDYAGLIAGSVLLVVVGAIDDRHHLPAWSRFLAQISAALIMILGGGVVLTDLGQLLTGSRLQLGILSIPITVIGVVGVINAVNMMDGLDGLAGGIVAVCLSTLSVLAWLSGQTSIAWLLLVLLAVVLGFLLFNWRFSKQHQARVFMGDAGSMFLGFVLAWFLVSLSQGESVVIQPVTALWLLALPLIDTVALMVRRSIRGNSPFLADRQHMHHALLHTGLSITSTVVLLIGLSMVFAIIGSLAQWLDTPGYWLFYSFAAIFLGYFVLMNKTWRH
jgi:UDP-GlcNAc:undecaprenyl-phosphate/decaprenyl-phosphate GlcNAc-1-phosphate transferase